MGPVLVVVCGDEPLRIPGKGAQDSRHGRLVRCGHQFTQAGRLDFIHPLTDAETLVGQRRAFEQDAGSATLIVAQLVVVEIGGQRDGIALPGAEFVEGLAKGG